MKRFLVLAIALTISEFAIAALYARDLDGNLSNGHEGVYDDILDITWLANANLAAGNSFGVSGINANGQMNGYAAETFITAMNADDGGAGYLGVNTWRQSTVSPVSGGSVFDLDFSYDGSTDNGYQLSAPVDDRFNQRGQSAGFTGAELAYHYYNNLGGVGACSGIGGGVTFGCEPSSVTGLDDATNATNLALFGNLENNTYWTGTERASSLFLFNTRTGVQSYAHKNHDLNVWAVASGDITASVVPLPTTAWLFLSAIGGLIGFKRVARSR